MNLETKITIYKFTPQVFTLTLIVSLLSHLFNEKEANIFNFRYLASCMLRRPDSNRRPLGYEPNELPTAPLRDVVF